MKILVYYVNVGSMTRTKVTDYVKELTTSVRERLDQMGIPNKIIVVPVRESDTRLEVLDL
jgi:hypothetical protein